MKTKLILGSFLALATMANAQWSGTNPLTTTSDVGIGTTSPTDLLNVVTSPSIPYGGITIRGQYTGGTAWLRMSAKKNSGQNTDWIIGSEGNTRNFVIHDGRVSTTRLAIDSTGRVGIGTTTPADKLSVAGNVAPNSDNAYTCGTSTNRWSAVWSANGSIQTSDQRYKTNIKNLNYGLQDVLKLRPVSYNWKEGDNAIHIGLIAQELKSVINEVVYEGNDENKKLGVAYSDLIPVLIKAIQEQQAQIDALTQKASGTTGINTINTVETGFQMSQNEPNPFTHETVVKYTLPTTISNAFMAVYDLTGKQITTFPINERGNASVVLTSDKLSAGIYIYSIVADGKVVDSKRMIVAEK